MRREGNYCYVPCDDKYYREKGAVNAERFNDFLKIICSNVKNKLIILDNGKIHKKDETKKIIKDSGNFLLYTVQYHPRLNTIEHWFNQVKHYIVSKSISNYISLIPSTRYSNLIYYTY